MAIFCICVTETEEEVNASDHGDKGIRHHRDVDGQNGTGGGSEKRQGQRRVDLF